MKKIMIVSAVTLFVLFVGMQILIENPTSAETADGNTSPINDSESPAADKKSDDSENKDEPFKMPNIILINNGAL